MRICLTNKYVQEMAQSQTASGPLAPCGCKSPKSTFFVGPDLDLIQTVRQVISRQHYLEINLFSKKKTCPARSGSELFAGNQQMTLLGN